MRDSEEKLTDEKGIHTDFQNRMTYGEYLLLDPL
ncbi:MAG TPA: tryptophan 2,3-dioxygenase, partial [Sporolactobacillaceae bacterium]|nr:tryptophan 2,3-dioxygenase [Sporolactobacillaceae bacterium]